MGSGASILSRVRKALVIRAYNLRAADQTLIEQFLPYSFQKDGQGLYITVDSVKKCLKLDNGEYKWIEDLLDAMFSQSSSSNPAKKPELYFYDFIQFLEAGKPINISGDESNKHLPPHIKKKINTPDRKGDDSNSQNANSNNNTTGVSPRRATKLPPFPPVPKDAGVANSQTRPTNESIIGDDEIGPGSNNNRVDEGGERSIPINLSRISSGMIDPLPSSVKIHGPSPVMFPSEPKESTDVIIRPATSKLGPSTVGGIVGPIQLGKPLWRKREVVKQEKTVYYTTLDEAGEIQELVEKETTQSEVLHMECRETGEFAHRETTVYEQVETFNDEVVNSVRGNEEYVHLKSLEDEFHYSESTMPPKEGSQPPPSQSTSDPQHPTGEEEEAGEGREEREGLDGGGSYAAAGYDDAYPVAPFTAEELAAAEAQEAAAEEEAQAAAGGYVHTFMDALNISEIDRELAQEAETASPFQSFIHAADEVHEPLLPPSMKRSKSNLRDDLFASEPLHSNLEDPSTSRRSSFTAPSMHPNSNTASTANSTTTDPVVMTTEGQQHDGEDTDNEEGERGRCNYSRTSSYESLHEID